MYELTLTASERKAIDWIGDRYAHGEQLGKILREFIPADAEWDGEGRITFAIPEHAAWIVTDLIDEDDCACLTPPFRRKLHAFCDQIV